MPPNESLTPTNKALSVDESQQIAISGLIFLAEDEKRLERFFSLTGIAPDDIRERAKTADFQAAILEYLLADESLLLVFCANKGVKPEEVEPARNQLNPPIAYDP